MQAINFNKYHIMATPASFPRFFKIALRALNDAERDTRLSAWLGVAIVKGSIVIGTGTNRFGENSYVRMMWPKHRTSCRSVHAEINAIFKVRRKIDLRGSRMYIVRKTCTGEMKMARPCGMCMDALSSYGFAEVAYTMDDGSWKVERVPAPAKIRTTLWRRSKRHARRQSLK